MGVELEEVDLDEGLPLGVKQEGVELEGVELEWAELEGAELEGVEMSGKGDTEVFVLEWA